MAGRGAGFVEPQASRQRVSLNWVAPNYFQTLGTPQVAGRDFSVVDANGTAVAIVNQAFAKYYFSSSDPLGKRFQFEGQERSFEIVGVVGDAKYSTLHEPPPRTIYLHAFQDERGRFSEFAIRTDGPPTRVAADVRSAMQQVLKGVPISKMLV